MPDGIDEEDLDAELACLEDELDGEGLFESTTVPDAPAAMPNAPNSIPNGRLPVAPTQSAASAQFDEYGLAVAR